MFNVWACTNGDKTCKTALVKVDTGLPVQRCVVHFSHAAGDEMDAILLARHIQSEMRAQLEAIKRAAYKGGYQDGRARRRKKTEFYGNWNPECVGY